MNRGEVKLNTSYSSDQHYDQRFDEQSLDNKWIWICAERRKQNPNKIRTEVRAITCEMTQVFTCGQKTK